MPPAVLAALDIADRLKDYGAYAGVASILGLAVLSLLYFGQARELKRLKEWAGREPERAAEREARAAQAGPPRSVVAQPQPRPRQPAVPATAAGAASRPAGNGAPGAVPAGAGAAGTAAGPAAPAAPAAPGGPAGTPAAPPAGPPGADPVPAAPGTGPAAPGTPAAPGAPGSPSAVPAPAGPAVPPPGAPVPAAAGGPGRDDDGEDTGDVPVAPVPAPRPRPAQVPPPPRTAAGAANVGRHPGRDADPGSGRRKVLTALAGVVGAGLVALLLVTLIGGGSDAPPENVVPEATETVDLPSAGGTATTGGTQVPRGEVTVAVLNGTTRNGLAREAMDKLAADGYRRGTTDNAPDRTLQATEIAYAEGYQRAAQDIARLIDVDAANVKQLDRSTQVVAGEDANVVVTLGADKAS